jgi:hypothetical protein
MEAFLIIVFFIPAVFLVILVGITVGAIKKIRQQRKQRKYLNEQLANGSK